jgi:hypothetical protein
VPKANCVDTPTKSEKDTIPKQYYLLIAHNCKAMTMSGKQLLCATSSPKKKTYKGAFNDNKKRTSSDEKLCVIASKHSSMRGEDNNNANNNAAMSVTLLLLPSSYTLSLREPRCDSLKRGVSRIIVNATLLILSPDFEINSR